jgi:uncharacterized protein (TIGR02147 family)
MNEIIFKREAYKSILREVLKHQRSERSELTNKYLAERIPLQATYLSKFFNDQDSHLKDETLYRLCKLLHLSEEEIDYVALLKNYETSETPERQHYLLSKIEAILLKRQLETGAATLKERTALEAKYLLNPKCMLVQLSLFIESYQKNPRLLCHPLGLSLEQLMEILDIIEENGFISRDGDPFSIKEVRAANFHIEANELLRLHQQLMKSLIIPRLQETNEKNKKSFLVTFNMDQESYQQCLHQFDLFVSEVRKIAQKSQPDGVYQLSFDLFKWC